jgi:hypothetical protein
MNESTIYFNGYRPPEPTPYKELPDNCSTIRFMKVSMHGRSLLAPLCLVDSGYQPITVHVAVPHRRGIVDEIPTGASVLHIPVAFA